MSTATDESSEEFLEHEPPEGHKHPKGHTPPKRPIIELPKKAGFGNNEQQRRAYLLAQQALRRLADRGYALETDRDGVAQLRLPSHATAAPSSFDAMASAWPARRIRSATHFGRTLEAWRKRLGLSRPKVCEGSGVSLSFLQTLERGTRSSQLTRLLAVLDLLGLELVLRARRSPPQELED